MEDSVQFPRQALPMSKKGKAWGKKCLLWGESRTLQNYSPVRKSVRHKKINYDLLRGKIHMEDVALLLNPSDVDASYIPERIQHFPIMNSKLEVLIGEELRRPFDWRAVVTNPHAVSEIEREKKEDVLQNVRELIENNSVSEEDYMERLDELNDYYSYTYQDLREVRANELLKHYIKEQNLPLVYNEGFRDALAVGEEIYYHDIVGGEPTVERINPEEIRVFRLGNSNKIEDADIIIIEQYWNPGRVIDTYYDELTKRDIDFLDNLPDYLGYGTNSMGFADPRQAFIKKDMVSDSLPRVNSEDLFEARNEFIDGYNRLPYDSDGNVRVMRMLWKSKRKIQKVSYYNEETGEEEFTFYDENYVPDKSKGETSETLYIQQAWEGTLIGGNNHDFDTGAEDGTYGIFLRVRPKPVQYNNLQNPSKCSLGVVGSIYNLNGDKPFSMVDMMKPYNYLYDVLHYNLTETIASSWGSMAELDLAMIPNSWGVDKWLYFAKVNHLLVRDSFNTGDEGAAKGKLAGALNNNTQRIVTDASGNYIQQLMNLAEWVKTEMGEIVGINRQREGQIANRETVGGVERATLQSSYITERYFAIHNDVKRRSLTCLLETAKAASRGRTIKFRYITSDGIWKMMQFDGDEFAENDYGIVVDSSSDIVNLDQKIESLAQAALQMKEADLSTIMRMWTTSCSVADKIRILENSEKKRRQQAVQDQQAQLQAQQQAAQAELQSKQMEMQAQVGMNTENNETKVLVARIQSEGKLQATALQNSYNEDDGIQEAMSEADREKLKEQMREFDLKLQQDNKKLKLEAERNDIARISANKKSTSK